MRTMPDIEKINQNALRYAPQILKKMFSNGEVVDGIFRHEWENTIGHHILEFHLKTGFFKHIAPLDFGGGGTGVVNMVNHFSFSDKNVVKAAWKVTELIDQIYRERHPSKRLTLYDQIVWETFVRPGEVVEVRIPKATGKSGAWGGEFAKGTVSGYFDDHKAFCDCVKLADRVPHDGIYFTLQIIDKRLIGRAYNRLKPASVTTSDQNVVAYRWIPIDCDPKRPSGISSSEDELREALEVRDAVAAWMISEGGLTYPIKAMSGNGGHLLFELLDMPADEKTKAFVKSTIDGLAGKFDTDRVSIDRTVFNPARIWKLYGTTAQKGDQVPAGPHREARPYRTAYIDDLGEMAK